MTLWRRFLLACFLLWTGVAGASNFEHFVTAERLLLPVIQADLSRPAKILDYPPESGWTAVALPDVAWARTPGQASEGQIQTVWYRFTLPPGLRDRVEELYFYLPRWQTVGQVAIYGDERLLWQSEGDPIWNGFNQPVWVSLDPPGQLKRPQTIFLRMDSVPGLGGGITSAWVGTEADLAWRYRVRIGLQVHALLASGVVFLVLGFFALSVWWKRRHETLYLLCFIAALCFIVRYLHYVAPLDTQLMSSAWYGWVSVNSVSWLVAVILLFNFRLCGRRYPWLEGGMFASIALHGFLTLPWLASSEGIAALSSYAYAVVALFAIPATLLAVRAAWLSRSRPGLALAVIMVVSYPIAIYDLLLQSYQINLENIYLLPVTQVAFLFLFSIVIYQRYMSGIESLERSHEVLQQRLQQREAELADSYAKLREVERRQLLSLERQRLMRDMHDGVGGSLTGALRMMECGEYEEDKLRAALRDCVDELRLTIDSLEPVESDITVLLASLRFRLQPRLQAAGIQLVWRVEALPPLPWLTPGHSMHVMRIVQEVVTNIIKHAEASEITFSTSVTATHACIHIDDDGKGFDGPAQGVIAMHSGNGLGNISYRAAVLRGSVHWYRRDAYAGTRLVLSLPIQFG